MNRNALRRVHRWIFIFLGVFIVGWLASGLLMAMPPQWFGPVAWYQQPQADWSQVRLAPSAALARLPQDAGEIRDISLRQINDQLLYSLVTRDDREYLVNARDGSLFEFTAGLAEQIIRDAFRVQAPLLEISQMDQYNLSYSWGSLPAWRMRFQDAPHADYYLSQRELRMYRSSPLTQLRGAIISLHEFEPLKLVTDSSRTRKGLLIAISAIALIGALAGVWLTLPGTRK